MRWSARPTRSRPGRGQELKDGKRVADKPAPNRAARDVYVYFDKDQKVRAPVDAHSLMKMVDRRVQ